MTEHPAPAPTPIVRRLASEADYAACLALQYDTWGADFGEAVPPAILKVAQRLGGVAAGAFDERGELLGFVFGLTGVERGRVVHWSDMLAVRAELRDAGIGRLLKAWQREAAREAGAEVMYWTFDPLVARNAHLNFNRLGVRAHEYVRDMYGDSSSALHRGLGTDRLVVAWDIAGGTHDPTATHARDTHPPDTSHDAVPVDTLLADATGGEPPPAVSIAIPLDIHATLALDAAAAAAWRERTRAAWEWALSHAYRVGSVIRRPDTGRALYLLHR